tara:strand:+ start:540 stop:1757 length:1218 start_codon:yes stop_codon:yes gene_type:complete
MSKKKTFEQYAAEVQDLYGQRMYVIPGQEYVNGKSNLWHFCKIHKVAYQALPINLLKPSLYTCCPKCNVDSLNARNYAKTISFVGQTTPNGHLILEHVGYKASPSAIKLGKRGAALFRYQCSNCGDTEGVALGLNLKKPGHIINCPECRSDTRKAQNLAKTTSFVGQTTPDGHLILEHVGYKASPKEIERGEKGNALFRYQCGCCGNTEAVAHGESLKKLNHTPNCDKCRRKGESIKSHLRSKERAMAPCQLYVCAIYFGDYIKIGISNNYDRRSYEHNYGNPYFDKDLTPEEHYKAGNIDLSYEDLHFLSEWHPRSWIFSVEQILLAATRDFIPKAPLPKEMLEACWTGQTELRVWQLEPKAVEAAFHKLIAEIQAEDGDWYKVYCRHINKLKIDPALCPYFVA